MNARQTKKCLKKRINRLESDNDLMRRIIADSPNMQRLYDLYNEPHKVRYTTMPFQEFKAKRMIPDSIGGKIPIYVGDIDEIIEYTEWALAKDLFECIKNNITYEVDTECMTPTITASIFLGRRE